MVWRLAALIAGILSYSSVFTMDDEEVMQKELKERGNQLSYSGTKGLGLFIHDGPVMDLVFLKSALVSTAADETIQFSSFNANASCSLVMKGHKGISSLATTSGGYCISSSFNDKIVKLWDPNVGECINSLSCVDANPEHLVTAGNVALIGFFSGANKPVLWDIRCQEKVALNVCTSIFSRPVSIDGQASHVAIGEADGGVSLWKIGYKKPISKSEFELRSKMLPLDKRAVVDAITFDDEHRQMVFAGYCARGQETLVIVDMVSKKSKKVVSNSFYTEPILSVDMPSDNSKALSKNRRYFTVTASSLKCWKGLRARELLSSDSASFHAACVHPNGGIVACAEGNDIRLIYNTKQDK